MMPKSRQWLIPRTLALGLILTSLANAADTLEFADAWQKSKQAGAYETFTIRGTGDRNNPLRRGLKEPFSGDRLFVQFRLAYRAAGIDQPGEGDGEFFVFWFDDHDGGDGATHVGRAPNVGIHVRDRQNRFMARYNANQQAFSGIELEGDREYRVAARLSKSVSGAEQPFDRIDVWIDPAYYAEQTPDASAYNDRAIASVEWFGFSTGRKTEPSDRIDISNVRIATTWRGMLGLPPATRPPASDPDTATDRTLTRTVSFQRDVLPILRDHCFECHAGKDPESGLRLDVLDEVLNQVTPRHGAASHLIHLVRSSDEDLRMPPLAEGRPALNELQIKTLAAWIDEGLDWDEARLPAPTPKSNHWAFQRIVRPRVPAVENNRWVRTPVDAFIASRHQELGIAPSEPASIEILTRRISLDLTGLPPDDLIDGESDEDPHHCVDMLIERQLSSLEYGQRYGRHWLDLARFGESNGYQHNRDRPQAWRYRDYVIESFCGDKPLDQFIKQQIAGDQLEFSEENLIATGFLAAARYSGNELDPEIQRNDILVDVVNTTTKAILGITMECAQCHTHKFDPFTIRDYYRLQAFFGKGQPANLVLQEESKQANRLISARWEMFDDVHARLVKARRDAGVPEPVLVIPKSVFAGMKGLERELFQQLERDIQALPQTWGWNSPSSASTRLAVAPHEMRWPLPRDPEAIAALPTYIRVRGDVKSRGPEVEPAWPAVFGPTPNDISRPRQALAEWMTSPDNPLTARVWVNRIWQWHFGRGLVASSGDFGTQGTPPSHPQLLDWLASELVDSGWSSRHVHRLILRSNTYRQSSAFSQSNHRIDPDNVFFWRWLPRRLESESIRDTVLAVAGKLDLTGGGPSVPVVQAAKSYRRSVYLQQKRDNLPEALSLFDSPEGVKSCSRRNVSTVSLQPLYLLNSEFINRMAAELAERISVLAETDRDIPRVAIRLVLGRTATPEEIERAGLFLQENSLQSFCQSLMNLNEFLYIN